MANHKTTATPSELALAALVALRDATERALSALERDDPDAARLAVIEGNVASARIDELYHPNLRSAPEVLRQVDTIRVMQAVAVDRAARGRDRAAAELDSASARTRVLRGYRPAHAGEQSLDLES